MSVLSLPRIFFKGQAEWNPATGNNNDQWPTYDFPNADLNWSWLEGEGITRENFTTEFPKWVTTLKEYKDQASNTKWMQSPSEWNYYGGNNWFLHTTASNGAVLSRTTVIGGQLAYTGPVITQDNLVNAVVEIYGDRGTPARMVDVNPDSFWCTDFYARSFEISDKDDGTIRYLWGDLAGNTRIVGRWVHVQRNLNVDGRLQIAGVASVVLQACLPNDQFTVHNSTLNSTLLKQLDEARQQPGVQGVMVRFTVYMASYFSREEFQACSGLGLGNQEGDGYREDKRLTCQYTALAKLWAAGNLIQNPAVSRVVGTIGLWMQDELVSVPEGRYLVPCNKLTAENQPENPTQSKKSTALGLAVAELHSAEKVLSVDFSSAIPEIDFTGTKADYGPITVRVQLPDHQSKVIATLASADYDQARYEAAAGIIDLPFPTGVTPEDIQSGTLLVEAQGKLALSETAISKHALTVHSDQGGLYIDEGQTGKLKIRVRQRGAVPTQAVKVLLTQYVPDAPPVPGANPQQLTLATPDKKLLSFPDAPDDIITVSPASEGEAVIGFKPVTGSPGFPNIVSYPFLGGEAPPKPNEIIIPVYLDSGGPIVNGSITIASAFYASVRMLSFDNNLPQEFADLWNSNFSKDEAWNFLYSRVLYLYHLIFPVMKFKIGLDLSSQEQVTQRIATLANFTDCSNIENTLYMPVTRDLSAGRRTVIQMYKGLVDRNFEPEEISPGPLAICPRYPDSAPAF